MDTYFVKSYREDLYDEMLTASQYRTYSILCSFDYDNDCKVHPSQETLAKLAGLSERQIRRNLKSLELKGYIKVHTILNYAYHKSKNVYFLVKKFTMTTAERFKNLSTNTGHERPEVTGHNSPAEYSTGDYIDDDTITTVINSFGENIEINEAVKQKITGRSIGMKGLKNYIEKVIATVKNEKKVGIASSTTYYTTYKKSSKTDNFNNFEQRDYDKCYPGGWDGFEAALLAASNSRY